MKKICLLLYVFACAVQPAAAQQFGFRNMNNAPVTETYYVMQDSKGYMWFAGNKGMCRYDGIAYKLYNVDNGLPDNTVFKLCEDTAGRILFYTSIGRVGYIYNDSVYNPGFNKYLEKIYVHGRAPVFNMYVDAKDILWIAGYNGICKNLKAGDYSALTPADENTDSCRERLLTVDKRKSLTALYSIMVKEAGAMCEYSVGVTANGTYKKVTPVLGKLCGSSAYSCSVLLNNGAILAAVRNNLVQINTDFTYTITRFNKDILYVYQDKEGGLWIGCKDEGVAYYGSAEITGSPVWSLQGLSVSCITMDREGGIWATTLEKGVFYTPTCHVTDYSSINGLNRAILSLGVINGNLLANDYSSHLMIINNKGVGSYDFSPESNVEAIYDYLVKGRQVYIGTSIALMKGDASLKQWSMVRNEKSYGSSICYNLALSPDSTVYIVNHGSLYCEKNNELHVVGDLPTRSHCMCVTRKGAIYIGCNDGVYICNKNNSFTYLGKTHPLLGQKVNNIKEDRNGMLWVMVAGRGIVNVKDDKVFSSVFNTKGGAKTNCNDVAFDTTGTTWVATDYGLVKIAANGAKQTFTEANGLISSAITKLALQDTVLWVGTAAGLCKMAINYNDKDSVPPPVYLSSVYTNDVLNKGQHDFSYKQNNMRFVMQGLTYKGGVVNFIYRLTGIDSEWHNAGFHEVLFNSLPPGHYTFQVKALNADGVASRIPAAFSFIIEKPFWLRWWFIMAEIMAVAAVIYAYMQRRLNSIRKKEEEKTRINKLIAEHEITALRTQMNPHFIFNAINSIQNYVLRNEAGKAYDYLANFSLLIRMMLNHSQDKELTLQKELEMIKLYVSLEQLRFDESFAFRLNIEEGIDTGQVYVPAMMLQPYVENAIWHGLMNLKDKSNATLSVTITMKDDVLYISVEDNGVGRAMARLLQKDASHKSFGMSLNKKRMELLNKLQGDGNLNIEVFDLYDKANAPSGTRVKIGIHQNNN